MCKNTLAIWLIAMLMVAMAGCAGNLPGVGQAQQSVCQPLENLAATVDQLAAISVDATTTDVKELKAQVDGPIQTVRAVNNQLNSQRLTELLAAYDEMAVTVDELPEGEPLGADVVQRIQTRAASVQAALGQATDALNCGGS